MNDAQLALYTLKKSQTLELSTTFSTDVAALLEESRDLALRAWCEVGGGKSGQALLEVLMKQISAVSNMVELLNRCAAKRRKP
jgi:hypothetical protein